jgi:hypothetical protein
MVASTISHAGRSRIEMHVARFEVDSANPA